MKTGITIWNLKDLINSTQNNAAKINNNWVPARPYGWSDIMTKIKAIKLILTEKADVVVWPENQ